MRANSKILITGAGVVCGAGRTINDVWDAIENGRSAIRRIESWNPDNWPVRAAAEVAGVDSRTLVEDRKLHKLVSRADLFGLYASNAAVQHSRVLLHRGTLNTTEAGQFDGRSGVFAATGDRNHSSGYEFFPALSAAGGNLRQFGRMVQEHVNPLWLLRNLPNNVVCHIGVRHNFKGTNTCITNQCTGGALAVAEAAWALRAGEADRAVAVACDAPIEPERVLRHQSVGLMSLDSLRPFDKDRSGTVFGEGAAAIMLETAAIAETRNAAVLGEFLGSGCTTEATGLLHLRPDGSGLSRAIDLALADAQLAPKDVGLIVAHGSGTRESDASEVEAIRRVFGQNIPPMTAFKWAYGHLMAASGLIDLVVILSALGRRTVPGIANLGTVDPQLTPLPISSASQHLTKDVALVLCRGFGGMNVALLIQAPNI